MTSRTRSSARRPPTGTWPTTSAGSASAMTPRRLRWKAPGGGASGASAAPGRLLITADCGGLNGARLWKVELQKLARELEIMICHLPPGTSKWNRTSPVLVHQPELARQAAAQPRRHRQPDQSNHHRSRPQGLLRCRRKHLSEGHQGCRDKGPRHQARKIPERAERGTLANTQYRRDYFVTDLKDARESSRMMESTILPTGSA